MSEKPKNLKPSVLKAVKARAQHVALRKAMHDSLPLSRKRLDEQVDAGTLSKEMADEVFAANERICKAPPELTTNELEVMAFMDRLKNRQGIVEPDFGALYKRKAELDRDPHEPRP
jgi:hypothetical protein